MKIEEIRVKIGRGDYRFSDHAVKRMIKRSIDRSEIEDAVLIRNSQCLFLILLKVVDVGDQRHITHAKRLASKGFALLLCPQRYLPLSSHFSQYPLISRVWLTHLKFSFLQSCSCSFSSFSEKSCITFPHLRHIRWS